MENDTIQTVAVQTVTDEMENMYLNFRVDSEVYGIEIRHVLQIIGMQEINEMPESSPDMKGFINLRGNIIPVYSMRLRFGKIEDEYTDRNCIIVVMVDEKEIGLIVDAIEETITIEPDSISPPPTVGTSVDNPYAKGIAQLPEGRIAILLDTHILFTNNQL